MVLDDRAEPDTGRSQSIRSHCAVPVLQMDQARHSQVVHQIAQIIQNAPKYPKRLIHVDRIEPDLHIHKPPPSFQSILS